MMEVEILGTGSMLVVVVVLMIVVVFVVFEDFSSVEEGMTDSLVEVVITAGLILTHLKVVIVVAVAVIVVECVVIVDLALVVIIVIVEEVVTVIVVTPRIRIRLNNSSGGIENRNPFIARKTKYRSRARTQTSD